MGCADPKSVGIPREEDVGGGGHAHRGTYENENRSVHVLDRIRQLGRTRVAGVGLAHDIGRQGTDGGNGDVVGGLGGELGHGSKGRGMRGSLQ